MTKFYGKKPYGSIYVSSFTVLTTDGIQRKYSVRCPDAGLDVEVDTPKQALLIAQMFNQW